MNASEILPIVSAFAPFVVVAYLAWKDYRSGSTDLEKKIRSDYKERNEQLEKRVKDLEDNHHINSVEIGKLQAKLEEKDKQIAKYEQIFQNRNPDLTKVLEEIKNFMEQLNKKTEYQTVILEQRQKRDKMIDEASRQHKGEVMRAPVDGSIINNNNQTYA